MDDRWRSLCDSARGERSRRGACSGPEEEPIEPADAKSLTPGVTEASVRGPLTLTRSQPGRIVPSLLHVALSVAVVPAALANFAASPPAG